MANHHLLLFLLLSVFIGSISAHAFPDHPHRHVFRRDSGDQFPGCRLTECYRIGFASQPNYCKHEGIGGVHKMNILCGNQKERSVCC